MKRAAPDGYGLGNWEGKVLGREVEGKGLGIEKVPVAMDVRNPIRTVTCPVQLAANWLSSLDAFSVRLSTSHDPSPTASVLCKAPLLVVNTRNRPLRHV